LVARGISGAEGRPGAPSTLATTATLDPNRTSELGFCKASRGRVGRDPSAPAYRRRRDSARSVLQAVDRGHRQAGLCGRCSSHKSHTRFPGRTPGRHRPAVIAIDVELSIWIFSISSKRCAARRSRKRDRLQPNGRSARSLDVLHRRPGRIRGAVPLVARRLGRNAPEASRLSSHKPPQRRSL
jgi:hypothetical protein